MQPIFTEEKNVMKRVIFSFIFIYEDWLHNCWIYLHEK